MGLLTRWLVRLYPQWWQQRYGAEYRALLEDLSLRPQDVLNVLLGALDAHIQLTDRRYNMQDNDFKWTGAMLVAMVVLMTIGMLSPFLPFLSEPQADMLVWFAPLLSMGAASALHARFQEHEPERSRKLLRLSQVGLVLAALAFVYGTVVRLVWGQSSPTLGLFLLVITSIFITWMVLTAITGWQTGTMHPALIGIGLLSALLFALIILALFMQLPLVSANVLITSWLGANLAWLVGLALSVMRQTPQPRNA